ALQLARESGPYQNDGISYQYDALGRLIGRTVDTSSESFTYDTLSRIASHSSALGAIDLGYLGETSQMTSRQLRGGGVRTSVTYDSNANDRRVTGILNNGARGYQYTTTPQYLVSRIAQSGSSDGTLPAQTWDFTYDQSDRLMQSVSSAGPQYSYGY